MQRRTCGEHNVLGDELVVHDGELGQLYALHARDGVVPSTPVELNVIRRVTIWNKGQGGAGESRVKTRCPGTRGNMLIRSPGPLDLRPRALP